MASWPGVSAAVPKKRLGGQVDQGGGEGQCDGDSAEKRVGEYPTDRNEAWSVRAAKAVPTWQATMPSQATVVACW